MGDEVRDQRVVPTRVRVGGAPAHPASVLHPEMMAQPAPTTAAGGGSTTTDVAASTLPAWGAAGEAAGRPRRRRDRRPRRRQPQGPDAPGRPGGGAGSADRRGRAGRGAVGRRPALQAERAGRRPRQPAAGVARGGSAPAARRRLRPRRRLARPPGAPRRDRGRRAVGRATAMPSSARLAATMALDLVRGPLVPEEPASWFDGPRQSTERSIAATRLLAAEAALVSGDPVGAVALAARGLDHDPYDEAALRSLMRGHVALGRPASALAAYAEVRTRLADDLGVSPSPETEALHAEILGVEPEPAPPAEIRPAAPERWDPLVQRARAELAAVDFDAARRDASEAVRRGAGASALEVAGWVAYYDRDFPSALRFAELAARTAWDDERRTSALTLSGRARHSRGDLAGRRAGPRGGGAEHGRRGPGHRARCGSATCACTRAGSTEAIDLSARGAVDAAALRHPFVIPHAMWARIYALGAARSRHRDVRGADVTRHDSSTSSDPSVTASVPWSTTSGVGSSPPSAGSTRPHERHRRAMDIAGRFTEPRHHALFDLALAAVEAEDAATATAWLAQVEVPPDDAGAMAWHQRHRQRLLEARVVLIEGDPATAAALAAWVRDDAARRGARRAKTQAEVVQHLVAAATGSRRRCRHRRHRRRLRRRGAPRGVAPHRPPGRRDRPCRPLDDGREPRRAARRHLWPRRRPRPSLDPERALPPAGLTPNVCGRKRRMRRFRPQTSGGTPAVRMIMRRTRGAGWGPRSSRARATTCRRVASGSDAMNGATWAMPTRQATRSAGVRSGNGTAIACAVASRPARAATASARSGGGQHRHRVGPHLRDPRVGGPAELGDRFFDSDLHRVGVVLGVGGDQHHATGPDHPSALRERVLGVGHVVQAERRHDRGARAGREGEPPRIGHDGRRALALVDAEHPLGQVELRSACPPARCDGAAGGSRPGADVGDQLARQRDRATPRRGRRRGARRRAPGRLARPHPWPSRRRRRLTGDGPPPGHGRTTSRARRRHPAPSPTRTAPARRAGTAPPARPTTRRCRCRGPPASRAARRSSASFDSGRRARLSDRYHARSWAIGPMPG